VVAALTGMPQPVVAAVNGAASGAGLSWILACDLAVAVEGARLVPGFVAVGLVPAAGTNLGLGRLVGRLRAGEMLMLGGAISAGQALELGLLHSVVPAEQLLDSALELAGQLAGGPRRALAATKQLLNQAARGGLPGQLEDERRAVMMAADQPDFAERSSRFVRKKA
jgi:2-(1,2-epoxy-1,2-dihydrophenyl)acetyl-CoA isomerase